MIGERFFWIQGQRGKHRVDTQGPIGGRNKKEVSCAEHRGQRRLPVSAGRGAQALQDAVLVESRLPCRANSCGIPTR